MIGARDTDRRDEKCIQILIGYPEGKGLHGRPRHRLKNIIRMGLKEVWWETVRLD
jgi:hypothetical protein